MEFFWRRWFSELRVLRGGLRELVLFELRSDSEPASRTIDGCLGGGLGVVMQLFKGQERFGLIMRRGLLLSAL